MSTALAPLLNKFATRYEMGAKPEEVANTLKQTCFKGQVSDAQMVALLIVADQYKLNPFTKELYAFPDKNNGIVPVVGLDGWSRIINEHPQFDGMDFEMGADGFLARCGGPGICKVCQAEQARAALAQPSPAPELERPEVVGYRSGTSGGIYTDGYGLEKPEPLMTVSQHDRIVGALRSENEKLKADVGALEWLRNTFKVHKALVEQAGCETIEQLAEQRDAAQAMVAELEKQQPVAWMDDRGALHTTLESASFRGQPVTPLYAAPVAQAGQVPYEPTETMLHAGMNAMKEAQLNGSQSLYAYAGVCWDAMIAAAPAQGE